MKHYYFVSYAKNHSAVSSCIARGSIESSTFYNREVALGSPIMSGTDIWMVEEMIAGSWTGGVKPDEIKIINYILLRTE